MVVNFDFEKKIDKRKFVEKKENSWWKKDENGILGEYCQFYF